MENPRVRKYESEKKFIFIFFRVVELMEIRQSFSKKKLNFQKSFFSFSHKLYYFFYLYFFRFSLFFIFIIVIVSVFCFFDHIKFDDISINRYAQKTHSLTFFLKK